MNKKNAPPKHLSRESRLLWKELTETFELDDVGARLLLEAALVARDRAEDARRTLLREGVTVKNRWGEKKPHPSLAIERDSRLTMMRALRALNLDLEPLRDAPGRPPRT